MLRGFMRRFILTVFCIVFFTQLFAYEFEVKDIFIDEYDMKNALGKTVNDANDDPCAVLRIETDIKKDIFLVGSDIFKREKTGPGEYYFFVSYRTNWIKFTAEGYDPFLYQIPLVMKSKKTYVVKLTTLGGTKENIPVVVFTEPLDAKITINNLTDMQSGIPVNMDPGRYHLTITKEGYTSVDDSIDVSEANKSFNYTLKPMDPGRLDIATIPDSAQIIVDNIDRGLTPKILYMFSGTHIIEIKKTGYKTLIDTLIVTSNKDIQKTYTLEEHAGNVKLNIRPNDAKILINKENYSGRKSVALSPGLYKIELTRKGYQTYEKIINVELKKDTNIDIDMVAIKGRLNVNVTPSDANCQLFEENQLINNWNGPRFFQSILIGEYKLIVNGPGYKTDTLTVIINENQTTEINHFLQKEVVLNEKNPLINTQKIKGSVFDPFKVYPFITYSLDGCIKYQDINNNESDKYAYGKVNMAFKIMKPIYLGVDFNYNNAEHSYSEENLYYDPYLELEKAADALYFAPFIQVHLPYQFQPFFRYKRILENPNKLVNAGSEMVGGLKYFDRNVLLMANFEQKSGNQLDYDDMTITADDRLRFTLDKVDNTRFNLKLAVTSERMNPVYAVFYSMDHDFLDLMGYKGGDFELNLFMDKKSITFNFEDYFYNTTSDSTYSQYGADMELFLSSFLSTKGHVRLTTNDSYENPVVSKSGSDDDSEDSSTANPQVFSADNEVRIHIVPDRFLNIYGGGKYEFYDNDYISIEDHKISATAGAQFRFGDTYRSGALKFSAEFKLSETLNREKIDTSEFKLFIGFTGLF